MKKVVMLSAFFSPFRSGAEACVEEVAVRLADEYDITIVTARLRRDLPRLSHLGGKVPVVRIGFGFGFDKWLFPFLAPRAVRKLQPDLIHAVLETFAGLALHLCKRIPVKRLLTLQTTNRSFLKQKIVRSPDAVTAISNALINIASEFGRNDVTLIPNGVDLPAIQDAVQRNQKTEGSVLFVGRLEKMKGIDTLLSAFSKITSEFPQAHLRIVGDGSQKSALEQLASSLCISDRVTFAGFVPVPDVYDEFAKAQIFCGLSRSEALGNVFIEAQAAGCSIIGTNIGGIPDVVKQGAGILVNPNDIDAAATALRQMLSSPQVPGKVDEYDWGRIAQKYKSVYEILLS